MSLCTLGVVVEDSLKEIEKKVVCFESRESAQRTLLFSIVLIKTNCILIRRISKAYNTIMSQLVYTDRSSNQ